MSVTFFTIVLIAKRGEPIVVRTNLENIPMQIGAYIGTADRFPDTVYEELNADLHLYRHYRDQDGNMISLYIGYYGTAKGGELGTIPIHVCRVRDGVLLKIRKLTSMWGVTRKLST